MDLKWLILLFKKKDDQLDEMVAVKDRMRKRPTAIEKQPREDSILARARSKVEPMTVDDAQHSLADLIRKRLEESKLKLIESATEDEREEKIIAVVVSSRARTWRSLRVDCSFEASPDVGEDPFSPKPNVYPAPGQYPAPDPVVPVAGQFSNPVPPGPWSFPSSDVKPQTAESIVAPETAPSVAGQFPTPETVRPAVGQFLAGETVPQAAGQFLTQEMVSPAAGQFLPTETVPPVAGVKPECQPAAPQPLPSWTADMFRSPEPEPWPTELFRTPDAVPPGPEWMPQPQQDLFRTSPPEPWPFRTEQQAPPPQKLRADSAINASSIPVAAISEFLDVIFAEPGRGPVVEPPSAPPVGHDQAVEAQRTTFGRLNYIEGSETSPGRITNLGPLLLDQTCELALKKIIANAPPGTRVLTEEESRELKSCLEPLQVLDGVAGCIILGYDGLVIANTLPLSCDLDVFTAWALVTYMSSNSTTEVLGQGRVEQIVSRTLGGMVLLADFGQGLLLAVSNRTTTDAVLPLMRGARKVTAA